MTRLLNMDIGCRLSIAFYGLWMPLASYKAYTLAGIMLLGEITSGLPILCMALAGLFIVIDCFANSRDSPSKRFHWIARIRWCLYAVVCFGLVSALFAGSRYQEADLHNGFMYLAGAAICLWAIGCEFRSRQEGFRETAQ